jgi:hypothetical protein
MGKLKELEDKWDEMIEKYWKLQEGISEKAEQLDLDNEVAV